MVSFCAQDWYRSGLPCVPRQKEAHEPRDMQRRSLICVWLPFSPLPYGWAGMQEFAGVCRSLQSLQDPFRNERTMTTSYRRVLGINTGPGRITLTTRCTRHTKPILPCLSITAPFASPCCLARLSAPGSCWGLSAQAGISCLLCCFVAFWGYLVLSMPTRHAGCVFISEGRGASRRRYPEVPACLFVSFSVALFLFPLFEPDKTPQASPFPLAQPSLLSLSATDAAVLPLFLGDRRPPLPSISAILVARSVLTPRNVFSPLDVQAPPTPVAIRLELDPSQNNAPPALSVHPSVLRLPTSFFPFDVRFPISASPSPPPICSPPVPCRLCLPAAGSPVPASPAFRWSIL